MLDFNELEQLIAFADTGTLSKTAEMLNLSQPTVTRTMQHLEETFGVPLFTRGRNRIALNPVGELAVEQARGILRAVEAAEQQVRELDRKLRTLNVSSCAPAPLWFVLPALTQCFPGRTLASTLKGTAEVLRDLEEGNCHLAILPEEVKRPDYACVPFLRESLSVCVRPNHALAGRKNLALQDLNGFNFLLRSELGFWDALCRAKMPASRFLVQRDEFEMSELIRESDLPCFSTNLANDPAGDLKGRIQIPITDPEANVTYYLVFPKGDRPLAQAAKRLRTQNLL